MSTAVSMNQKPPPSLYSPQFSKNPSVRLKRKSSVQELGLSSAGNRVFQVLYLLMQENPKKDKVYFHFSAASQLMSLVVFKEGLADLLAKEVIYRSTRDFSYFVNVNYMIQK